MPTKGTAMRKITQLLRLHFEAELTNRQIARSLNLSVGVVNKYINRALKCSLSWPLPAGMDEQKLSKLLQPSSTKEPAKTKGNIDFSRIHQELKIHRVTYYNKY